MPRRSRNDDCDGCDSDGNHVKPMQDLLRIYEDQGGNIKYLERDNDNLKRKLCILEKKNSELDNLQYSLQESISAKKEQLRSANHEMEKLRKSGDKMFAKVRRFEDDNAAKDCKLRKVNQELQEQVKRLELASYTTQKQMEDLKKKNCELEKCRRKNSLLDDRQYQMAEQVKLVKNKLRSTEDELGCAKRSSRKCREDQCRLEQSNNAKGAKLHATNQELARTRCELKKIKKSVVSDHMRMLSKYKGKGRKCGTSDCESVSSFKSSASRATLSYYLGGTTSPRGAETVTGPIRAMTAKTKYSKNAYTRTGSLRTSRLSSRRRSASSSRSTVTGPIRRLSLADGDVSIQTPRSRYLFEQQGDGKYKMTPQKDCNGGSRRRSRTLTRGGRSTRAPSSTRYRVKQNNGSTW